MEGIIDLVLRAQEQDKDAFMILYNTVYKDLYRFVYYSLQNKHDAEDVVSETVLAAYETIGKLKNPEAFKSWIFRIAINKCNQKIRHYMKRETTLTEEMESVSSNVNLSMDIEEALLSISLEERQIVVLHTLWGYKGEEIAEMMGLKHSTVRSKYSRALEKLKQKLQV